MSRFHYVLGTVENGFEEIKPFEEQLIGLEESYSLTLFPEETSPRPNPFDCSSIVIAIDLKENSLCGFAKLSIEKNGRGRLDASYVVPKMRENGLWSNMIDILTKDSDRRNLKELIADPIEQSEFLRESLSSKGFEKDYRYRDMLRRK